MHLAFATKDIRSLCESEAEAIAQIGEQAARALRARLSDLEAAASPRDLPSVGNLDAKPDSGSEVLVDLADGYEMAFSSNHVGDPNGKDSIADWSKVIRIKILRIERRRQ